MSTRKHYCQVALAVLCEVLLVSPAVAQGGASFPSLLDPVAAEYTETQHEFQQARSELRAETEGLSRRLDEVRAEFGMAGHLAPQQVADRALVECCDAIALRNHLDAEFPPFLYSPTKTELEAMLDGKNFPSVSAAVWEGSETPYLAGIDPSTLTPGWKTLEPEEMMGGVGLELERLESLSDWPPFLLPKKLEVRPSTGQLHRDLDSLHERLRRKPTPLAKIESKRRDLADTRDRIKTAVALFMRVDDELRHLNRSFEEGRISVDEVRATLRRDFPLVEARITGGTKRIGRQIVRSLSMEVVKIAEKPIARVEDELTRKFPLAIERLEGELRELDAQRRAIEELDDEIRLTKARLLRAELAEKAHWERRLAVLRRAIKAVGDGRKTLLELDEQLRLLRTLRKQGRVAR